MLRMRSAVERGAGRVGAAGAVDAPAGVGRRGGQVETTDGRLGPAEPGNRPEHRLLRQRGRATAERAAGQVGVDRLQGGRAEHVPTADQGAEPRRMTLDLGLHAVGERLHLGGVPLAGEVAAGVTAHAQRDVGVRPDGLGAHRRAGRVGLVHLPDQHEGARGDPVLGQIGRDLGEAVHARAHVDGPGVRRRFGPPGDRTRERPVDLERGRVVLEAFEVGHHSCGQVLFTHEVAVERGGTHVGEHTARRGDRLAVGEHDGHRAPVAHLDPRDGCVAPDDAARAR